MINRYLWRDLIVHLYIIANLINSLQLIGFIAAKMKQHVIYA